MRKLLPLLPFTLLGIASAAPCTTPLIQQSLKGPVSTTYQIVTKDRVVAGQTVKGKTTVQSTSIKQIPNGVQFTTTADGKSNVMKMTCVNGKTVMEVDGKVMPSELSDSPKDSSIDLQGAVIDFKKHNKVGDTWSGVLSSVKTKDVTSETKYTYKILGVEKITTPAGTFDSYKVQQTMSIKMTMPNMPKDMKMPNMDTTMVTTSWYDKAAPNMTIKSSSDDMTMTLLKYSK